MPISPLSDWAEYQAMFVPSQRPKCKLEQLISRRFLDLDENTDAGNL